MKHRITFMQVLVLLVGAVVGGLISQFAAAVPVLRWLSFGQSFGLSTATLELGLLSLTFGFSLSITVAGILGLVVAIIICRWMD